MRRKVGRGLSGINFEMAVKRIKSGYPKGILVYESGVHRRVQSEDIDLEILSIWMAFKTKIVGEVTKCMSVDRKEKRSKE